MQPFAYARAADVRRGGRRRRRTTARVPRRRHRAPELAPPRHLGARRGSSISLAFRASTASSRLANGGLRIGALVRLNDAAQHPDVVRDYPVLSQAILKAASAQLRNLATIGGNPLQKTRCPYFRAEEVLPCNKRVPGLRLLRAAWAERPACDLRLDGGLRRGAACRSAGGACSARRRSSSPSTATAAATSRRPSSIRCLPMGRLVHNVLRRGELITAIELPAPAPRSAYLKIRERESYEYATVSAAAVLEMDGDTIASARASRSAPSRIGRGGYTLRRNGLPACRQAIAKRCAQAIEASFADARPLSHNAYKITLARNAALRVIETAARISA